MKFSLVFPNGSTQEAGDITDVFERLASAEEENTDVVLKAVVSTEVLIDTKTQEPIQNTFSGKPAKLIEDMKKLHAISQKAHASGVMVREFLEDFEEEEAVLS